MTPEQAVRWLEQFCQQKAGDETRADAFAVICTLKEFFGMEQGEEAKQP